MCLFVNVTVTFCALSLPLSYPSCHYHHFKCLVSITLHASCIPMSSLLLSYMHHCSYLTHFITAALCISSSLSYMPISIAPFTPSLLPYTHCLIYTTSCTPSLSPHMAQTHWTVKDKVSRKEKKKESHTSNVSRYEKHCNVICIVTGVWQHS